jgi:hypothetical protein
MINHTKSAKFCIRIQKQVETDLKDKIKNSKRSNCPLCDKTFTTIGNMKRHQSKCKNKKIHVMTNDNKDETIEELQKRYIYLLKTAFLLLNTRSNTLQEQYNTLQKAHNTLLLKRNKITLKTSKVIGHLRVEKSVVHIWRAGDTPFGCYECSKSFTSISHLSRHLRCHTGDKDFHCTIDNCSQSFALNGNLSNHIRNVHNIGDIECPICIKKVARLRNCITCTNTATLACRKCFAKITGKDIRIECEFSDYLDEHFHPEYRICTDNPVNGDACLKYRPDGMWASGDTVIQWECDEKQHKGTRYDCDEKRISDLYDEFPGKTYIVVRINPDGYKAPKGTKKPSINQRKELLVKVMNACLEKTWEHKIHVVYMFYSPDNTNITRNIPKILLPDNNSIDNFCI